MARRVTFEVVTGPGVRATVLNPLAAEQEGGITRVRLGDFVAEQEVTLLVAVEVEPRATGEVASLQCRVSDRDGVLPALPMQVDWAAVSEEQDRDQPVNRDVIVAVARMLAEGARLLALSENRKGGYGDARRALGSVAEQIRRLGDDTAIREVADLLAHEEGAFSQAMAAKEMKARHYAAYKAAYSRDPGGSARKRKGD